MISENKFDLKTNNQLIINNLYQLYKNEQNKKKHFKIRTVSLNPQELNSTTSNNKEHNNDYYLLILKITFYNSYYSNYHKICLNSSNRQLSLARSIFAYEATPVATSNNDVINIDNYTVFCRGYDKFTDHNKLKIQALKESDYYELTIKENGCLIMASTISINDKTKRLIISSKNSIGLENNLNNKHANYGEQLIIQSLQTNNIPIQEFIDYIDGSNVTLLFELCDDNFEEHIFPYKEAGLYLHGIVTNNLNNFECYTVREIEKIAAKFGFKMIKNIIFNKIKYEDLMHRIDYINGTYENREIEGFVIRTKIKSSSRSSKLKDNYINFMFKIKFDYPYLMYREWRELTKLYVTIKQGSDKEDDILEKLISTAKYPQTKDYLSWLQNEYAINPKLFMDYLQNKGIIKARESYLLFKQHKQEEQ